MNMKAMFKVQTLAPKTKSWVMIHIKMKTLLKSRKKSCRIFTCLNLAVIIKAFRILMRKKQMSLLLHNRARYLSFSNQDHRASTSTLLMMWEFRRWKRKAKVLKLPSKPNQTSKRLISSCKNVHSKKVIWCWKILWKTIMSQQGNITLRRPTTCMKSRKI